MPYPIGKLIKRRYGQKHLLTLEEEVYVWPASDTTINQNGNKFVQFRPPSTWYDPRNFKVPLMIGVVGWEGLPPTVSIVNYGFDMRGNINMTLYNFSVLPVTIRANSVKFRIRALVARLK